MNLHSPHDVEVSPRPTDTRYEPRFARAAVPAVVSGGLERRGEVVGAGLDGLGNRHDKAPVPIQDLTRVDDGQANDLLGAWCEAKNVSLGRFFAFTGLRLADVQVEDVAVGVIVGVVEGQRSDT